MRIIYIDERLMSGIVSFEGGMSVSRGRDIQHQHQGSDGILATDAIV